MLHTCTGSLTPPCPIRPRHDGRFDVAFPLSKQGRHTQRLPVFGIESGELNGRPACTSRTDAQHDVVTAVAPPLEAEVAGFTFFVGLFHSQFQTGLSRHTWTSHPRFSRRFLRFSLTVTVCGEAVGWVKRAKPRFGEQLGGLTALGSAASRAHLLSRLVMHDLCVRRISVARSTVRRRVHPTIRDGQL